MSVTILALAGLQGNAGHYRSMLRGTGVNVRAANETQNDFALGPAARDERRPAGAGGPARHDPRRSLARLLTRREHRARRAALLPRQPSVSGGIAGVLADVPCVALGVRSFNPTHYPQQNRTWFRPYYGLLASSPRVRMFANSRVCADDYAQWLGGDPGSRVVYNGLDTGTPDRDRSPRR